MHSSADLLQTAAMLVISAFVLVALCSRLRIPTILGYLLAGILVGPSGLGLVPDGHALSSIGELGVVLLLFMLGLEFSYSKLISLRHFIFGLGAAQVLVTMGVIAGLFIVAFSEAPLTAILLGGAVAMSSTALCLKVLAGAHALGSPQGRIAIAVLLFQDLAAVLLLLLHDSAAGNNHGQELLHILGGLAMLGVALYAARGPIHRLACWVEDAGDAEVAQLLALTIALVAAMAAIAGGLSPALGAFAAGMIIAEGDARHLAEKEIRPFRDLFVGIFFIAIGTQMQVDALPELWPSVLMWLGLLIPVKFSLGYVLVRGFGEPDATALRAAAILAHGGEFSLMLVSVSMASGLVASSLGGPLLLALGVSMLLASVIIRLAAHHQPEAAKQAG